MPELATVLSGLGRLSLRGGPEVLAAASDAFSLQLPREACRAAEGDARAALWLGPDEQLLLVQQSDWEATMVALTRRLAGLPHALVDISQRQVALQVAAPHVADTLSAGCPLDLHPDAFPIGMCTRTLFFKAPIVLWRTAADAFHLEVWRSFVPYVQQLLREVAREYEMNP
jgi:sarcosine oxidase subunit gamma